MSQSRILSVDNVTQTVEHWVEDADGQVSITSEQDVTDLVAHNTAAFNDTDERARWKGDIHLVARIPLSVLYMKGNEGVRHGDQRALRRFLNDPDNRAFRVRPGRV